MTQDELIALLRSWHDFFPLPETWTGELQRTSTARGPAPFRRVSCPKCAGRGELRGGWKCPECRGLGVYWIDVYTGEPILSTENTWTELLGAVVNCSRCGGWGRLGAHAETRPDPRTARICDECDGTGKVPAPLFSRRADPELRQRQGDRELDALESQRDRREGLRAYRELAAAMDELQVHAAGVHFLVSWTYVLEVDRPGSANRAAIALGLSFLLERLEKVSAPAMIKGQLANRETAMVAAKGKSADRRARQVRNDEIRRRRADGAKVAELAAAFGLDKGQVSRIVNAPTK